MRQEYFQPFLQIISRDYPKIHEIVDSMFKNEKKNIQKNIYNIFCNFLYSRFVAVSRDWKVYKQFKENEESDWYSWWYSVKAQDLLIKKKLIHIKKGHRANNGFKKGVSSVIIPTRSLDNMFIGIALKPLKVDPSAHPVLTFDKEPLTLEEIISREKSFFKSPINKEMLISDYKHIEKLNKDYFSKMELNFAEDSSINLPNGIYFEDLRAATALHDYHEDNALYNHKGCYYYAPSMATNVFLTSMFTSEGCGRLYQRCNSYQNLPKEMRKHLTINKQPTLQSDYSGMVINIVYFLCNEKNQHIEDPYLPIIEKLKRKPNPELREAIKKSVIIAFNENDVTSRIRALRWNHPDEYKTLFTYGVSPEKVYDVFLEVHSPLKNLFKSKKNIYGSQMLVESTIIKNILEKLHKKRINGLPLHDCIIYEKQHKDAIEKLMLEEYRSFTGNDIGIKTY